MGWKQTYNLVARYHLLVYDAKTCFVGSPSIYLYYWLKPQALPNIQPWPNTGVGGRKSTWPTGSPPPPHHHSRAAGWIITPGHRFLWRSIKLHGNTMIICHISHIYPFYGYTEMFHMQVELTLLLLQSTTFQKNRHNVLTWLKRKYILYLNFPKTITQISLLTH